MEFMKSKTFSLANQIARNKHNDKEFELLFYRVDARVMDGVGELVLHTLTCFKVLNIWESKHPTSLQTWGHWFNPPFRQFYRGPISRTAGKTTVITNLTGGILFS